MRRFPTPFETESEDKIIGGYISIRQFGWLSLTIVLFLILFVLNRNYFKFENKHLSINYISLIIRAIIVLLSAIISAILAFLKIKEMNADKYIFKKILYIFKDHKYIYKR